LLVLLVFLLLLLLLPSLLLLLLSLLLLVSNTLLLLSLLPLLSLLLPLPLLLLLPAAAKVEAYGVHQVVHINGNVHKHIQAGYRRNINRHEAAVAIMHQQLCTQCCC
jgi:hypothetical protein